MAKNNDVYFEGRLGRDPERKGGVVKFSLAVWAGKDRETGKDKTLWLTVICFKELAGEVEKSFRKGDEISVSGKLDMNVYKEKEYWQVIADTVNEKKKPQDKDFPAEEDDVPL